MSHWSVQAWMTGASLTISPKESLRQARALLRTAKVRELLVVDGGKLVGIVSERDIWAHCPTSALVLDDKQADELLARIPPLLGGRGSQSSRTASQSVSSPRTGSCRP